MKALVVYESMYGNTHLIADAIGTGLSRRFEVTVLAAHDVSAEAVSGADLLVVGGPTHAHGMSWPVTRQSALDEAHRPESPLELDPDAEGPGLRDWFDDLKHGAGPAAAFDTRAHGPAALTGRASKGIARRLHRHGFEMVAEPESFLVTKDNHLEPDERSRAEAWGEALCALATDRGR